MRLDLKRQLSSYVLLAVFLPILLFSSLHLHDEDIHDDGVCAECVHKHCGGHIVQNTNVIQTCVLCQFLGLTFLNVCSLSVVFTPIICVLTLGVCVVRVLRNVSNVKRLRAPPYHIC